VQVTIGGVPSFGVALGADLAMVAPASGQFMLFSSEGSASVLEDARLFGLQGLANVGALFG